MPYWFHRDWYAIGDRVRTRFAQKEVLLAHVTLAPYIVTEPNGSDPRIVFPITTPAAFVLVETRKPGVYLVKATNQDGASLAIKTARTYARTHRPLIDRLYAHIRAALNAR